MAVFVDTTVKFALSLFMEDLANVSDIQSGVKEKIVDTRDDP